MGYSVSEKQAAAQKSNPLVPIAYTSGAISGGVVGTDYALWFDIHPVFGAVLGSIISTIITSILLSILANKELKDKLITAGAVIGAIAGIWSTLTIEMSWPSFFGGLVGGAILGAIGGFLIFILIILVCFCLLLISRGPIALYLRDLLTKYHQDNQGVSFLQVEIWSIDNFLSLINSCV